MSPKARARDYTFGEQQSSISELDAATSRTLSSVLQPPKSEALLTALWYLRVLTVSLPRDHLDSAVTSSATLVHKTWGLFFRGWLSTLAPYTVRFPEARHPFIYLKIPLSFQEAILHHHFTEGISIHFCDCSFLPDYFP